MKNELTEYKPQTAIEVRRGMARVPQVIAALNQVERTVFLASTSLPIEDMPDDVLGRELAKALQYIAKDTGYRGTDLEERGYLVLRVGVILKRYYAGLTMVDFKLAFEMCLAGELDEYLPKGRDGQAERGHYQQFNAEYICKVLNAYRLKRGAVFEKAMGAMPIEDAPVDDAVVSDLMKRQKEIFAEVLEGYREQGRFPDGMTAITEIICCDVLAGCGLMPEIVVTPEEQNAVFQRMMNHYARRGEVHDLERLRQAGPEDETLQQKAFMVARRKALRTAIERIIKEGIEIKF